MNMKEEYSKDFDAILLVYSVLKRLGSGGVGTFTQRLISQKVQYLAQVFGVSPQYRFNLYLRGPYSSFLANDLFKLKEEKIQVKKESFVPQELEEKFQEAKKFVESKTARQLELTTTLHWLKIEAHLSNNRALAKLKEIKSPNEEEVKETISFVEKLCRT